MKTMCVTGHRPDGLPWKNESESSYINFMQSLKEYILFAIANGYTHFISGGALGVDTYFALCVLSLKKQGYAITLEIAVPCLTQSHGWSNEDKAVYDYILKESDLVTVLSEKYYTFCMQRRNEYMVNKSDCVLCCFNGVKKGGTFGTVKLAQKQKKPLLFIDLSEKPQNGGNRIIYFLDKII